VVAVGPGTDPDLIDRRVTFWAMPPAVSGTYAEYAVAPAEAHRLLEGRATTGKTVLLPNVLVGSREPK
jgi:hypothetical protein